MGELNFDDLMRRLERLEFSLQMFSSASEKADYNATTIFVHLLRIYMLGDSSQSYHKWCNEISTRINEIYECRKTKGGKFLDNKYILKCLLSSVILTKPKTLKSKVFNDETNYTVYRDLAETDICTKAIELIKEVLVSNDISTDYLESLFENYKN